MTAARLVEALDRGRWVLLALLVPALVLAAWGATRIGVDNAVDVWFVEGDPALVAYDAFQEEFGSDEVVVLAVHREGGVLTPEGLARVEAVTTQVEATEGIAEVTSLTRLEHIRLEEDFVPTFPGEAPPLYVGPLVEELPETAEAAEAVARRVREDRLVRGRLVSEDGTTALVLGRMGTFEDFDARRDVILADLEGRLAGLDGPVPEAGIGVLFSALNRASTSDMAVVGTASYALILVLLGALFGRLGPVVLTVGAVGLAAALTMGLFGALDRDLNMVTMALPTLVLILGVADCVHLLHRVAASPGEDPVARVREGVAAVFWPCLFTSLTTAAGFLGLTTAKMQVVRDLGAFSAAGVLLALGVSLVAVLAGARSPRFIPAERSGARLRDRLVGLGEAAMARRREVLGVSLLVLLGGAWGVSRLDVDTYSIDYFYPSHPVRQDSAFLEETFGPYTPLEFVVDAPEGLREPAALAALAAWQDKAEADPAVGWTRSIADVTRRLNQVLGEGSESAWRVPEDALALEQALLVYESDPDADTSDLVNEDWTRARVTVGVKMMSAREIGATIDRLLAVADLPEGVSLSAAGYLPLYVTMMDYIVRSQITSFVLAFVLVFGLLALLFRSVRLALLAMPANLLPVFLTLGVMGMTGIRLDVATVTIAALVLGLVVDDTTHFLYAYRRALGDGDDHEGAVREALGTAGVAMTTTTVVLVLGFSVLGLATVKSVGFFGLLSAVAMATALLADLVFMPALLVTLRPRLR